MLYFDGLFFILNSSFFLGGGGGFSPIHQELIQWHGSSLLSYHASLLPNESCLRRVFFRVLLFEK